MFNEPYSRGTNSRVNYSRRKPFSVFLSRRMVLVLFVALLYIPSIVGVIYFAIVLNFEAVLVAISLFVAISTFFAAIYIAWYQRFLTVMNGFPFINVNLYSEKNEDTHNLMKLSAIDNDFVSKSEDVNDVINVSKSPCSLIKISDPDNTIYDVDLLFVVTQQGLIKKTKYFVKIEQTKTILAIPVKDMLTNGTKFVLDNDENKAYYCAVYRIKTKTNEYYLKTQILFANNVCSAFCLDNRVIYKDEVIGLKNVKRNKKEIDVYIKKSSEILDNCFKIRDAK